MKFIKIKYIIVVFILILPALNFAQDRPEMEMEEQEEEVPAKIIDPKIKLWYLNSFGAFKDSTTLDTLQDNFHLYHPVLKKAISVGYVGNYATPYQNNNFFERNSTMDFFFLKSREAYLLTPANIKYYNTVTPYTQLDYSQSENKSRKNETRFNVLHTQNVNPYLNITFRFDQARSEGQYKSQASKNNFVTFYSNYNKNELSIHGGFITNAIQNSENGGLTADSLLLLGDDTDLIDVNLTESNTELKNIYVFGVSEYRIGKYISVENEEDTMKTFRPFMGILYSFGFQQHLKQFKDNEDSTNVFFPNTFYGNSFINDSIKFRKIENIIQLKQYENSNRKTSFGKRVFLGQEFNRAELPEPYATFYKMQTKKFSNVYAGGGIFRQTGNFWTWNAEGKFYLLGRNVGQTELSGIISKPLTIFGDSLSTITVKGVLENKVADYFQEEFYSNHIRWDNNFKMEQNMTVNGIFRMPKYNLEAGANYSIINNFIYNDTLGIPSQTGTELLVVSAYLDKDFNYRNWHFRTRLLWQKASDEQFIHLPEFSTMVSAYYKFVVSKVLSSQLGVDARYNTSYYADAYAPSTGLFYLQNDVEIGEFPYIDVYASVRLKRTRVFFKMKNIGTEFVDKGYFTIPHYPMNRRTFRLGVSWVFYD